MRRIGESGGDPSNYGTVTETVAVRVIASVNEVAALVAVIVTKPVTVGAGVGVTAGIIDDVNKLEPPPQLAMKASAATVRPACIARLRLGTEAKNTRIVNISPPLTSHVGLPG